MIWLTYVLSEIFLKIPMILRPVHDLDSHSLLSIILKLLLPLLGENILEEVPNFRRLIPILDHPQFLSVLS